MNRHIDEGLLHDLREGFLSGEEEQRVRAHLEECPRCRREVEALAQLSTDLAGLPQDVEPSRDLWPQILWRMGDEAGAEGDAPPFSPVRTGRTLAGGRRINLPAWQLLAASLAVALLSGGSVWLFMSEEGDGPETVAETSAPILAVPAGLEEAFGEYETNVSGLEEILAEGREVLDPETVRVSEDNLAIIDEAISEAREALSRDPGSNVLRRLLTENLRRKVALLRHAAVAVRAET
jgi:hypothetical protein